MPNVRKIIALILTLALGAGALSLSPFSVSIAAATSTMSAGNVSTSKTATLTDAASRTYNITMSAWRTKADLQPVDMELVLDRSGSMGNQNGRVAVATSSAELGPSTSLLNLTSYNSTGGDYGVCGYAWSNGTYLYPVRYDPTAGWQYASNAGQRVGNNPTGSGFLDYSTPNSNQFSGQTVSHHPTSTSFPPNTSWVSFNTSQVTSSSPLYGYKWALLLKSVNGFLKSMQDGITAGTMSSSSRVNVITFGGYYYSPAVNTSVTSGFVNITTANASSISQKLGLVDSWGSTQTDQGMQQANTDLSGSSNQKVAILFTDGAPTSTNGYQQSVANGAITAASNIRGLSGTVYSVGIFTGVADDAAYMINNTNVEQAFLYPLVNAPHPYPSYGSAGNYFRVTQQSTMESIFQTISTEIKKTFTLRDYIDPHFVPVDASGNPIAVGGTVAGKDSSGNTVTGTLKQDSTGLYVEWASQTLPVSADGSTTWSVTFPIKAQDTFIGGTSVPTNLAPGNGSTGVYLNNPDGSATYIVGFTQPTVDVPIRFSVGSASGSIFLGDTVPTANGTSNMFDPTAVKNGSTTLNAAWIAQYGQFTYAWQALDANGNPTGPVLSTGTTYAPPGSIGTNKYRLSVTYTPNNATSTCPALTVTGVYTLTVTAGTLTLTKTVNGYPGTDLDVFTFHVSGPSINTDVILKNGDSVTLQKLAKGSYTITEVVPQEYTLSSVTGSITANGGSTTVGASNVNPSATFTNAFAHVGYFHSTSEQDNAITQTAD